MFIRIVGGAAVAASLWSTAVAEPEEYKIDKAHTQILYEVDHLGFARSHGRFADYDGKLLIDKENPNRSSIEITVNTESLDSFWPDRTKELLKLDFFNVAEFPQMSFKSTAVEQVGEDRLKVTGNLTILAKTNPVSFDVTVNSTAANPMNGAPMVGLRATTRIKRSEFGMSAFVPAIGDEVDITIDLEAQKVS